MLSKNLPTIKKLDVDIDIKEIPTIKSAELVFIEGKGALETRWHTADASNYAGNNLGQITLNDIPLVQINAPDCPTCVNLLATGYGIANAKCQELEDIQAGINAPFISLDVSIKSLEPLLGLLKSGLYVIADAECYPTDGNGNFFWNAPNELTENPATARLLLPENDYADVSGHPVYLYPTQDTDCYNEDRVINYVELFKKADNPPRAIAYWFNEFISFILDGHHKACAAALLRKRVNCIVIIPFLGFSYKQSKGNRIKDSIVFASLEIPINSVPKEYLPPEPKAAPSSRPFYIKPGTINHRRWQKRYTETARAYPTIFEYINIIASELPFDSPVSDKFIEGCMLYPNAENWQKLKAVLCIMKIQNDPRLQQVSMDFEKLGRKNDKMN